MTAVRLARALALTRIGVGVAALARPAVLPRLLGVDAATVARTSWVVQLAGIRDLALGAGALVAGGPDARLWLTLAALADAGDALALASAARGGRVDPALGAANAAVAAAAAAVGGGVALALRGSDRRGSPTAA